MEGMRIAFVGGGNMSACLIGGLIADGAPAGSLVVADPDEARRAQLVEQFGVHATASNADAAGAADVIVLAVKPQVMAEAATSLSTLPDRPGRLFVSVAAGVRVEAIERWIGGDPAVVRAMPNTPALLRCGATALFANARTDADRREAAEHLMRAVGSVTWIDSEPLLDVVTALSGSGPAYFFLLMEALQSAARELGLSEEAAGLLTQETALGAARMALESEETPGELRRRVTSPGGTTAAALDVLREADVPASVRAAVSAATDRARELAREFGAD